jgi:hypothetical protein
MAVGTIWSKKIGFELPLDVKCHDFIIPECLLPSYQLIKIVMNFGAKEDDVCKESSNNIRQNLLGSVLEFLLQIKTKILLYKGI